MIRTLSLFIALTFLLAISVSCVSGEKEVRKGANYPKSNNGYVTDKINFFGPKNYNLLMVDWIDEKTLMIVYTIDAKAFGRSKTENEDRKQVFLFDLNTKKLTPLFKSSFPGGLAEITLKHMSNGRLCLEGGENALIFDKNLKLVRKIPFPEGIHGDTKISYNGQKLAYTNEDGLYISDWDQQNVQLVEKHRKNVSTAKKAVWSFDSSKFLYFRLAYNLNHCVVIADQNGTKIKEYPFPGAMEGFWFTDNHHILVACDGFYEELSPHLKIIDTMTNDIVTIKKKSGIIDVLDVSTSQDIIYKYTPSHEAFTDQLFIMDYTTKEEVAVTPKFRDIYSCHFSPSGEKVIFIGLPKNKEERGLFFVCSKEN